MPWYCAAQIQQRLSQAFLDTESTAADGGGGGTGATAPRPERAAANGECHSPGVLSEDRPRPKDRSVGGGHSAPSSAAPTSFRPGQVGDELEHSSALLWSATATRCRLLLPLVLVTARSATLRGGTVWGPSPGLRPAGLKNLSLKKTSLLPPHRRGRYQIHPDRDSNPEPSVPKTDALPLSHWCLLNMTLST